MTKTIKIGVFLPNAAQLLDTACVDVLGTMSKKYLSMLPILPPHVAALAPDVVTIYISSKSMGGEIPLSSDTTVKATHDYTELEVAPGKLDIIVVPGPDPSTNFEEDALQWLHRQANTDGVDILCICTGIFLCGAAGILNGKKASGPRGLQHLIQQRYPKINLVGSNQRWVQDGNIWSSGGITNGNDLMAAYARSSSKHWPQPVVEIGLSIVEVGDRSEFYEESESMILMGFAWQTAKAWFQLRFSSQY